MGIVFLGIGSWALYSLFNQGASDFLSILGINNFYIQTAIVILIVVIFFSIGEKVFGNLLKV